MTFLLFDRATNLALSVPGWALWERIPSRVQKLRRAWTAVKPVYIRGMSHWLSVDFDFFIPEEFEWDFGHSEAHPPELQHYLWCNRVASMASCQGKDLVGLTAFRPESLPTDFWATLTKAGYDLRGAKIAVAESHKEAGPWFLSAMNEDGVFNPTIVNIDAHHDLGYCSKPDFKKLVKEARVDAGSWLGVLMHLCPEMEVELVFPQWKPTAIADTRAQAPIDRKVWSRVGMMPWPMLPTPSEPIERVFVCRSGAWSPPWHDAAFEALVQELVQITGSTEEIVGEPVVPRPWSTSEVQDEIARMQDALSALRRKT